MYMYKVDLQVFPSKKLFFSLSLPPPLCLPCFFSTRSIVFIGFAANDAATLENGWCDFYRRTGNMGHKTRLHFPQPEKKTRPPTRQTPLSPSPVKAQDLRGKSVSYRGDCGRAKMCSDMEVLTPDMGKITSHTHTRWWFLM